MRGHDYQQSATYSYLSPEQRVPADHPLRPIREYNESSFEGVVEEVPRDLCDDRTTIHGTREVVACTVIAGAVHGPQRAAVDGTVGVQPNVPGSLG